MYTVKHKHIFIPHSCTRSQIRCLELTGRNFRVWREKIVNTPDGSLVSGGGRFEQWLLIWGHRALMRSTEFSFFWGVGGSGVHMLSCNNLRSRAWVKINLWINWYCFYFLNDWSARCFQTGKGSRAKKKKKVLRTADVRVSRIMVILLQSPLAMCQK